MSGPVLHKPPSATTCSPARRGSRERLYVGMLYVGAAIKNSAFHAEMEKAKAAGDPVWRCLPSTRTLAGLLWTMHRRRDSGKPSIRSIACSFEKSTVLQTAGCGGHRVGAVRRGNPGIHQADVGATPAAGHSAQYFDRPRRANSQPSSARNR